MSQEFSPFLLPHSWQKVFHDELKEPYLVELAAFVEKEYALTPDQVYPPKNLIFNAFAQTSLENLKVVIVGQDPYHGPGQAHGLSFSVPPGIKPPPSLNNIFKELEADEKMSIPKHGCLLNWAKQGVLLLNATLTVRKSEPMSHHGRGWERFTDAVIRKIQEHSEPLVFILWGKSAQDKCRFLREVNSLSDSTRAPHLILTAAHPSPYSANQGFFGCKHFSKANQFLEQHGKSPIDWSLS